jgi:hypothetical protein
MRLGPVSPAALALLLALAVPVFAGASLKEFHAAVETAAEHNRVALGYLRTGNNDLALIELERLRAAWIAVADKYSGNKPEVFDKSLYTATFLDIQAKLAAADLLMKSGRPEATQASLIGIRDTLSNLRRRSGAIVLADCILDSNGTMTALGELDRSPLDWAAAAPQIEEKAGAYRNDLSRCDHMAAEPVKSSAEFRRLIDGAQQSLTLISKAIATRDADLFHRIVIELRSFDNLLSFRFG